MKNYHNFCPQIAYALGIKHAIIYCYIEEQCERNEGSMKFNKFGSRWMAESINEITLNLRYLSRHQVKDAIDGLVSAKLIERARFDGCASNWYCVVK